MGGGGPGRGLGGEEGDEYDIGCVLDSSRPPLGLQPSAQVRPCECSDFREGVTG